METWYRWNQEDDTYSEIEVVKVLKDGVKLSSGRKLFDLTYHGVRQTVEQLEKLRLTTLSRERQRRWDAYIKTLEKMGRAQRVPLVKREVVPSGALRM